MNNSPLVYIGALSLMWGVNLVVSRVGVSQMDPVLFTALRLFISSLFFAALFAFSRERRWPRDRALWGHASFLGVIGTALPMTVFLMALRYQSSGVTAIYITTAPALTVLAAHFFLADEPLNRGKSLGVGLALGGAVLLAIRGESGLPGVAAANPVGSLLILVGLLSDTVAAIYIRKYMRDLDALDVTSVRLTVAAAVMIPVVLLVADLDLEAVRPSGYLALGYATIIGALAGQFLAFYVTRRFGATTFALTAYLIPVVTTVTGVLALGEKVTAGMMVALALIAGGIAIIHHVGRHVRRPVLAGPPGP